MVSCAIPKLNRTTYDVVGWGEGLFWGFGVSLPTQLVARSMSISVSVIPRMLLTRASV
jgi:hypothetical protein